MLYTQTGTPYYASPEVWNDKPYDNKSDIWSLGCIIYEMASLNPPFRAANMNSLYKVVQSGIYPKLPQHYSDDLAKIIKLMLQTNPIKRPSCDQILDNVLVKRNCQKVTEDPGESYFSNEALLQTIHCPRNLS